MTFRRGNRTASKVTREQVIEIREHAATGLYSYGKLGIMYDLSITSISNIVLGYTHRDVGAPELIGRDKPPPNMKQAPLKPANEVAQSMERFRLKLAEEPMSQATPSLYDSPTPYDEPELSDTAANRFTKALGEIKPSVASELDKLTKETDDDENPNG